MKRKALFFLLAFFLIAAFVTSNAYAGTYVCTVTEAGAVGADSRVQIRLTDTASPKAFINQWFNARTGREKEMLAVALTALASGLDVRVWLNTTTVDSELQSMHIQK